MAGSFDLSAGTPPIAGYASQVGVFRYSPDDEENPFALIPNVRCLAVEVHEGPSPPTARFQYVLDDALGASRGWPSQFEDVWPLDADGPYLVRDDDRIVVADRNPDGTLRCLFDGFAQVPQVDVAPHQQAVTFSAVGVAIRCFDTPITGCTFRDSSQAGLADSTGESDYRVGMPARFNPANTIVGSRGGFLPNCTPDYADTYDPEMVQSYAYYPVFCDPLNPWGNGDPSKGPSYWTVGKAIRHLLSIYNRDQDWVRNPDFSTLDQDLYDYSPNPGFQAMDPNNVASHRSDPVTIRDYNAANKPWPVAVADLLAYAGFYMRWHTSSDDDGRPQTELKFYRRDEFSTAPLRRVHLDDRVAIADSISNAAGIRLSRDTDAIVNAWSAETAPRQVEISIALAPLFRPAQGDEQAPAVNRFIAANWTPATSADDRRKYRWYGADELGEGHLAIAKDGSTSWSTTPCAFEAAGGGNPVFPPDQDGNPTFVERYRPGHNALISTDSTGRPLRATLQVAMPKDPNTFPYLTDPGTVDVAVVAKTYDLFDVTSGWELLHDRLGIRVTADDPRQWHTGDKLGADEQGSLPLIDGVGWWANPGDGDATQTQNHGHIPILILTVTIDDDHGIDVAADPRFAAGESRFVSPTKFVRSRVVDGSDHFKYTSIDPSSRYYGQMKGNGQDPVVVRDDTEVAAAHVNQLRSKHEFPPVSGSVTIPFLTEHYQVGDRLMEIDGRDVYLTTNVGASQGEARTYPWIVGVSWGLESDRQSTTLALTDRRADTNNAW